MIVSFKDDETAKIFRLEGSRKLPQDIQRAALRRLLALHAATSLLDLREPPSINFEKLQGDREGKHSIRINSQWRICFHWLENSAHSVEIVDCH